MAREYVPVPIEYLEEMALLSDEDFGALMRALLRYGRDGTPITLGGDCRFYAVRVMNKDNHYADKAKREEEKKKKLSEQNSRNARARYEGNEGKAADACGGRREAADAGNTNPIQTKPIHFKPKVMARRRKIIPPPCRHRQQEKRRNWMRRRWCAFRSRTEVNMG